MIPVLWLLQTKLQLENEPLVAGTTSQFRKPRDAAKLT